MTITPDRWISSAFRRSDRRYFVRAIDTATSRSHYFFIQPNATITVPATRIDNPGTYINKKELPPQVIQAITNHLAEIEASTLQAVMNI